jgi:DNA-binding NtrC family response regulator
MEVLPREKKILIVDDNPHMCSLLADILEIFNYQGVKAKDGEEALSLLRKEKDFELVITDLRMPNLGGMDLLKSIKGENPSLPVVIITAFGKSDTKKDVMAAKADGYLAKPFRVNEIEDLLKQLLHYSK